jgi:hypothetical protein
MNPFLKLAKDYGLRMATSKEVPMSYHNDKIILAILNHILSYSLPVSDKHALTEGLL